MTNVDNKHNLIEGDNSMQNKNSKGQNEKFPVSAARARGRKINIKEFTALGAIIGASVVFGSEVVLAEFDLDAGGTAFTTPWVAFFNKFYPVGIVGMGVGGTVLAQGDPKVKFIGFGTGALLGGLIVSAVKAGFGI
jgi:hypothetical protein